ncbi:transcriptional regulator family: Fungal Specific TF [Penicillium roqueforti]|uniref:Zn(2)-C6 fungal-type DNA-binding domain n=1 Tax=Penicillium roqueforti (strain FM164) TaxID=1365484 RepID=W6QBT5_PENRF|nr:transcriptional regulator family: Fungal Specific TF [Penicillium roqueforti]CDM33915.1 Zn(2)-C6 fungal-type DNA-binding domain [Penicillium roqueforti FM164]KAI2749840.1 transcriptional regulator family: Fungal Specific TF [Penicillium roqueforti]KAI2768271.1 transcriptional regulator family: Fungal Specific TF [Penicillium roqueforti]KAI3069711.1 transcriptional regulator family: Fungal Specific TF [Penicillium roqueforti]
MTKGCYTCRRRRIICDNGQPTCRKCRDAGKECLGYQKPLVWVKGGVASRGKMMGRSFDDVGIPPSKPKRQPATHIYDSTAASSGFGFFSIPESSSDAESHSSGKQPSPETDGWTFETENPTFGGEIAHLEVNTHEEQDTAVVHVPRGAPPADYTPTPWGLVDPLLKDLSQFSRYYVHHYNQYMVNDFALYSQHKNPFRDLTALVNHSPVLASSIAALGALHCSLVSESDSSVLPWSSGNLSMSVKEIEDIVAPASSRKPASQAYHHFLEYKHRALRQLSMDLLNPAMQKDGRTLAAIVLLAFIDIFESGSGAWSYHIEGAKKLLKDRPESGPGQGILDDLDVFALDGCLIMEIMGSTLARPGALSKPFYSSSMGPEILKRLEENSWVGCPAYLLGVIFFVHALWYPESEAAAMTPQPTALPTPIQPGQPLTLDSFASLLQGIRDFDPVAWSQEMQNVFFIPNLTYRLALATSYQDAVYLYTSRVLSRTREGFSPPWIDVGLPPDHRLIATNLITQISLIPPSDSHFKCLIWPTFIAGAECRPSQRALILEKLGSLYEAMTSVNVRNAAWVLRLMWQKQDLKRREHQNGYDNNDSDLEFDWIEELDHTSLDWLFI